MDRSAAGWHALLRKSGVFAPATLPPARRSLVTAGMLFAAMRPRCVVAERFWLLPRRDALSRKTPEGATGGQPYRKHNLLVIASKRRADSASPDSS